MTTPLSSEELAEIRRLAEVARPGPWVADNVRVRQGALHPDGDTLIFDNGNGDDNYTNLTTADLYYIAAVNPTVVLRLLAQAAEAETLRVQVADAWSNKERWEKAFFQEENAKHEAEEEAARLREYAVHKDDCDREVGLMGGDIRECSCGLEAQLAEIREQGYPLDEMTSMFLEQRRRAEAAEAQVQRLREYTDHTGGCATNKGIRPGQCSCGLEQLRADLSMPID